jgi:pimeloyl-ACP methyl ester carboxylesterase
VSTPQFLTLPPGVRRTDIETSRGTFAALEALPGSGISERCPAVLVPGFTGSKEDFISVLQTLAGAGRRVLALDMRGQYETPGPDDASVYSCAELGADITSVIETLSEPVHLVGHSFGGLVCRAATIAHPAAVASLTLLDSGPSAIGGERRERMDALEPVLATAGLAGVYDALETLAAGDPAWMAAPVEHKDFLRRRFLAGSPAALLAMGDALRAEPDRTEQLGATGVPVLVAYGEHDDGWPPPVQADMAARLGAARTVIPGAVHSPAAQQPAATVRALLDFWADLSP